jgi:hypothetical protein
MSCLAADSMAKLTVYPIAQGRSAGKPRTNWVLNGKVTYGALPPPRRENWCRPGKLEEVLPLAKHLRLPFLDVDPGHAEGFPSSPNSLGRPLPARRSFRCGT